MDNGYYDMFKIIPDHVPRMGPAPPPAGSRNGGSQGSADSFFRASLASSIAYMRALRDRANREAA